MKLLLLPLAPVLICCQHLSTTANEKPQHTVSPPVSTKIKNTDSWAYFLQNLPEKKGPVLDYRGRAVNNQDKHVAIVPYDVGTRDLQQCADALIRLRAEYLFAQKRSAEISFHFVSGAAYSFLSYCNGKVPVAGGNNVRFVSSSPKPLTALSLRKYLDLVYTYASTLSLAAELKDTNDFGIGTVVIKPGSPGHCFIITDEAVLPSGEKAYKLVEGYTPAQSIYVLRNTGQPSLGFWHLLKKGPISTATYDFTQYRLKKFE